MLAHNIHEQGGIIIIVVVTGRSDDLRNRAKRDTMGKCALESCIFTKADLLKVYTIGVSPKHAYVIYEWSQGKFPHA